MIWFDLIWFDLIWFDLIWFDFVFRWNRRCPRCMTWTRSGLRIYLLDPLHSLQRHRVRRRSWTRTRRGSLPWTDGSRKRKWIQPRGHRRYNIHKNNEIGLIKIRNYFLSIFQQQKNWPNVILSLVPPKRPSWDSYMM